MPTPLLLADYGPTGQSTGSSQSTAVTAAVGDVLVAWAETSVHTRTISTPTGGTGLTWSLRQSIVGVSSYSNVYVWTARATVPLNGVSISMSSSGTDEWVMGVLRWTQVAPGATFLGAMAKQNNTTDTAPSMGITTLEAASALLLFVSDWRPVDGSNRVYRTPTGADPITPGGNGEAHYSYSSGNVTCYAAYHETAGPAGAKTVGLTAPTGQKPSIIAIELLGAVPGTTADLEGEGNLVAGAQIRGPGALGGDGQLAATPAPEYARAAALGGGGTLTGIVRTEGILSGAGTLTTTLVRARPIMVAALSGSGTLRPRYKEASFTGSGVLTATTTWRLTPLTWPVDGSFDSDGVFAATFATDGVIDGEFATDGIGEGHFAY